MNCHLFTRIRSKPADFARLRTHSVRFISPHTRKWSPRARGGMTSSFGRSFLFCLAFYTLDGSSMEVCNYFVIKVPADFLREI